VNILTFRDHQISQRDDSFVNLTQMAKANSKRLNAYLQSSETQKYLKAAQESICHESCQLTEVVQTLGFGKNKATWGHPLVALHFAQWISPEFHVWCNRHIKTLIETGETSVVAPQQEAKTVQIYPGMKVEGLSELTFGQLKRLFYFRCNIDDAVGPIKELVADIDPIFWSADITSISIAFEQLCLDLEERCLEKMRQELESRKLAIRLRKKDISSLKDGKISKLLPDFGRHYEQPVVESNIPWMLEVDR
jgi:hypothetical protein